MVEVVGKVGKVGNVAEDELDVGSMSLGLQLLRLGFGCRRVLTGLHGR